MPASRALALLASSILLVALYTGSSALGQAEPQPDAATLSPTSAPAFGPILDWSTDGADAYRQRLGASPAYFGQSVEYPLTANQSSILTGFVQQISVSGAAALLTVEPTVSLAELTAADAKTLTDALSTLHSRYGTDFLVRFAPEMNGTWHSWGQQPRAYVSAFDVLAGAVHSDLDRATAQMLWAPSYGAGYPFAHAVGQVAGAGPRVVAQADTNHDGVLDAYDDPYAPYYPGDTAVDWVGLSMYYYGPAQRYGANVVPPVGTYPAMLAGTYGYQTPTGAGRTFLTTYSTRKNKRMAVETAALFQDGQVGGPTELAVKQAWWNQVLDRSTQTAYPNIKLVAWLEQDRPEAEVVGARIDWRATGTPALAAALLASVRRDRITFQPAVQTNPSSAGPVTEGAKNSAGSTSWSHRRVFWLAVVLLVIALSAAIFWLVKRRTAAAGHQGPRELAATPGGRHGQA